MTALVNLVAATVAFVVGVIVFYVVVQLCCMSDEEREKYGHGPKGQGR